MPAYMHLQLCRVPGARARAARSQGREAGNGDEEAATQTEFANVAAQGLVEAVCAADNAAAVAALVAADAADAASVAAAAVAAADAAGWRGAADGAIAEAAEAAQLAVDADAAAKSAAAEVAAAELIVMQIDTGHRIASMPMVQAPAAELASSAGLCAVCLRQSDACDRAGLLVCTDCQNEDAQVNAAQTTSEGSDASVADVTRNLQDLHAPVSGRMQCAVCFEEHIEADGVVCSTGRHFTCTECFACNIRARCTPGDNHDAQTAAQVQCVHASTRAGGCTSRDFTDQVRK